MQYQKHLLPNKLTVLLVPMPSTESVTMMAMVKTGSRNETESEKGLAHFCEHTVFKGGKLFKNTQEISQAVDSVGGELNAFTGEETTTYYVKVAKENISLGLEVIEDLVINPRFPASEIEKEKGVIIEEINMYEDLPRNKVQQELASLIFPNHSLGWPIAGNKQTIKNLSRQNFVSFHQKMYSGENTTVILAGAVKESDFSKVKNHFNGLRHGQKNPTTSPKNQQIASELKLITKASEQSHLAYGFHSYKISDPKRYAQRILATILGGSMSSRLFLEIREKLGLCYYIQADIQAFTDSGYFGIAAGVDNNRLELAVSTIHRELNKIREKGIKPQELEMAKNYLVGKMKLGLEDSEQVAEYFVSQQVLEENVQTPGEMIEEIKAVKLTEVKKVAAEIFQNKNLNLAIIGPEKDRTKISQHLDKF